MDTIHLSNFAAAKIEEKHLLHCMSEDHDLEGLDDAEERAEWLLEKAPGAFVVIQTGDYLTPPCCDWIKGHEADDYDAYWRKHARCDTYDNRNNQTLLVPAGYWEANKDKLQAIDAAWREEHMMCWYERPGNLVAAK